MKVASVTKPDVRPANPNFSSGPCAKRPGWSFAVLENALVGRSHRSKPARKRIEKALDLTRRLLEIPDDYLVGIVPASDTGAMEMAMWSMLGERGVDVLAWESFGSGWVNDIENQLRISDVRVFECDYGHLPDLGEVDFERDVVFTWNGTTSGVRVPNAEWIDSNRSGLTICDATSAVYAQDLDFSKLDVVTFSWQKVLGGEAAHGMLVLSPRAVARLEGFTPGRPLPKIFRMSKGGRLIGGIFEGATINTISMLAIEDVIDAMEWAMSIGGLKGMRKRADANAKVIADWVQHTDWIEFLPKVPEQRSNTSICLVISDSDIKALDEAGQAAFAKRLVARLDAEGVAHDIGSYRDAPSGLRIWCGSTIEASDLMALTPWLDWAFWKEKSALSF